ncbi:MAG TPA: alpha/beta hydrolase [Acidimicrobiales bacterium]
MPNPSEEQVSSAIDWLNFQPVSTLKAIGRLFLETTDVPENLDTSRAVLENVSVSLIAGERSRSECDVPEWAISGARSFHVISGAGHLVPIEPPVEIATLINAASLAVELEA